MHYNIRVVLLATLGKGQPEEGREGGREGGREAGLVKQDKYTIIILCNCTFYITMIICIAFQHLD